MFSWGDYWKTAFDLAVFLFVPQAVRIERLRKRESERYGDLLKTDPLTIKTSKEFLEWAKTYDDSTSDGQSIVRHQREIESLSCSVLKISGDISVGQKVNLVVKQIASRKPTP